ncbi:hypothetical protein FISHEDRAFT_76796 [Fistulina hepatica ATCC 64428]|uniref:Uncharacterized protein n=1 Tax=Fistulina hepatica ATCC 64428 TaxID=1128425 RepID=A0A0D7A3D2_9AGAR|nr:hypothetical protein FISHEDRAFT_76796 [Fistulina hepatica ATCC 64428]
MSAITPTVSPAPPLSLAKDDIIARVIADAASPAVSELVHPFIDPEVITKDLALTDIIAFVDLSGYLPQQRFCVTRVLATRLWAASQATMSLFLTVLHDFHPGFDIAALPTTIGNERLAKLFLMKSPNALLALAIKENPLLDLVARTKEEVFMYICKMQCISLLFIALYCRILGIVRLAGLSSTETLSPLALLHIDATHFLQMVAPTQLTHDILLSGLTHEEVFQCFSHNPGPDAIAVTRNVIAHLDELLLQRNPSLVVIFIDMLYESLKEDIDGVLTCRLALPAPPTPVHTPPMISVYIKSDDSTSGADLIPDLVPISDSESDVDPAIYIESDLEMSDSDDNHLSMIEDDSATAAIMTTD